MQKLFENWRAFISERKGEAEEDMTVIPGHVVGDVGYGEELAQLYVKNEPTEIKPSKGFQIDQAAKKEREEAKKLAEKEAAEAIKKLADKIKTQKSLPQERRGVAVIVPCYAGDCPDQMIANDHAPFWNAQKVGGQFKKEYPGPENRSLRKTMLSLLTTDAPGIFGQYKSSPGDHYMYFGVASGRGRKQQRGVGKKIVPEMIIIHSSTTKNPYRTVSALGGRTATGEGEWYVDPETGKTKQRKKRPGGTNLKGTGHTLSTNYEIDLDGTIYEYFPAGVKTVHAGWTNNHSVGIDLTGKPADHTGEQTDSLNFLINLIRDEFPSIPPVVAPQLSYGQFYGRSSLKRLKSVPYEERYGIFSHVSVSDGDRSDPGPRVMNAIGAKIPDERLLAILTLYNMAPKAGKGISKEDLRDAKLMARAMKKLQRKASKKVVGFFKDLKRKERSFKRAQQRASARTSRTKRRGTGT